MVAAVGGVLPPLPLRSQAPGSRGSLLLRDLLLLYVSFLDVCSRGWLYTALTVGW